MGAQIEVNWEVDGFLMLENYSRKMIHKVTFLGKRPKMKEFDCNNSVKFETAHVHLVGTFSVKWLHHIICKNKYTVKWHSSSTDNIVLLQQSSNWFAHEWRRHGQVFWRLFLFDSYYLTFFCLSDVANANNSTVCFVVRNFHRILFFIFRTSSKLPWT